LTRLRANISVYRLMRLTLLRKLKPVLLIFAATLPGCFSTQQLVSEKTSSLFQEVAISAGRQSDVALVRSGTPAYLMLIDGMIRSYPENPELLLAGAKAYASYASVLEEDEQGRAVYLYERGKQYAVKSLGLNPLFKEAMGKPLDVFQRSLDQARKNDVPTLFWVSSVWGSWIASSESPEAMADLPWVEALVEKVLQLDPSYYYGSAHLFEAILLSARPEQFGGNLQKANEHFKKAMEYGQGKFLMTDVYYAQYYAKQTLNRELFVTTLKHVLETPAAIEPDLTLVNTLAQQKAKRLLDQVNEFF
jgi:tetratricopeptide (TPR) repeat protein